VFIQGEDMPQISFPEGERGHEEFVTFWADVDGKIVICKILLEALANRFGVQESNAAGLLKVFQANRPAIEALAKKLIGYCRYEPDGLIVIYGTDV
jgi:hypothetical protein